MFHIAICDNSHTACSRLEENLEKTAAVFGEKYEIEVFLTGEELCRNLRNMEFDLIFLRVDLTAESGIETGNRIRDRLHNDTVQIVYIGGNERDAMKLFHSRPMDYLITPVTFTRIFDCICVLKRLLKTSAVFFEYQSGYAVYKIPFDEILYFENSKRKINIITTETQGSFYGNMEQVALTCRAYPFIQIHKSYLVNTDYIMKYEYSQVTLLNGKILPISQPNRKRVRMLRLKQDNGSRF